MAENSTDNDEVLSVRDLRNFLDWETTHLTKATELRLRELGTLVTAYAAGEITPQEATQRLEQYHDRWNEALPGVWAVHGVSDEEILAKINQPKGGHAAAERRRNRARMMRDQDSGPDRS